VQTLVEEKIVKTGKIKGELNCSDIFKKFVDKTTLLKHLGSCGIVDLSVENNADVVGIATPGYKSKPPQLMAINKFTKAQLACILLNGCFGTTAATQLGVYRPTKDITGWFMILVAVIMLYVLGSCVRDMLRCWRWLYQPRTAKAPPTETTASGDYEKIYVSPSGDRFHVDPYCRGMRQASGRSARTPCLICVSKAPRNSHCSGFPKAD